MKNIYETYIEKLCKNCKNKDKDLCDIRRTYKGTVRCVYYEREKREIVKTMQLVKWPNAKKNKPIMKGIDK